SRGSEQRLIALARFDGRAQFRDRRGVGAGRLIRLRGFELRHSTKGSGVSSAQERPPYEAYAAIAGSFAALLAAGGALSRLLRRHPQCATSRHLALLALASFKAARTLTHDRVSAPMRAPFVEGEADAHDEVPVSTGGMQQAIGE